MSRPAPNGPRLDSGATDAARGVAGPTTILDRLRAAGIADDRAREWLTRSAVHLDGVPVSDPGTPAPWPTRWVINPGG